jgi:glutamine synthetase
MPGATAAERALASLDELGTRYVQLQFVDLFGVLKSVTVPARRFAAVVEHGEWFDGSAVDGFARVLENDMYLAPDLDTFRLAPAALDGAGAARVMCHLLTPDGEASAGDSREVLRRALARLAPDGLEYRVAPEVEFFLFDAASPSRPVPTDRAGYFDQTRDAGALVRQSPAASTRSTSPSSPPSRPPTRWSCSATRCG